jgi:hypothetical protein
MKDTVLRRNLIFCLIALEDFKDTLKELKEATNTVRSMCYEGH